MSTACYGAGSVHREHCSSGEARLDREESSWRKEETSSIAPYSRAGIKND